MGKRTEEDDWSKGQFLPQSQPLTPEEIENLRAKDDELFWEMRRGSLWVKRMTADWQTPTDDEVTIHRLLATLDAARPSDEVNVGRLETAIKIALDARGTYEWSTRARAQLAVEEYQRLTKEPDGGTEDMTDDDLDAMASGNFM